MILPFGRTLFSYSRSSALSISPSIFSAVRVTGSAAYFAASLPAAREAMWVSIASASP